ncbi:uncharacterized protein LOC119742975 isoform X1 [Patiria miniata]|uniref:Uncharacterized protein n=1 Tax=Patiria miniata TaxID=46514 RepID=A0A914BG10_PATMI|nr:uncharacterized protein LOC119742975 isoform X1 [Patiria miniata]
MFRKSLHANRTTHEGSIQQHKHATVNLALSSEWPKPVACVTFLFLYISSVFLVQRNNTKMDEKQGPTSDDVPTGEVTSTTVTEGDVVKMPTDVAITMDAIPNEDEEDKSKGRHQFPAQQLHQ